MTYQALKKGMWLTYGNADEISHWDGLELPRFPGQNSYNRYNNKKMGFVCLFACLKDMQSAKALRLLKYIIYKKYRHFYILEQAYL